MALLNLFQGEIVNLFQGEIVTARIERTDAYDLHGTTVGF